MHIVACLMVRDEEQRVSVTLRSCVRFVDRFVVLDTGSVDNTVGLIEDFCKIHKKPLVLRQSVWRDFSTNRNELLDLAEECCSEWLMLLDSNDELSIEGCFRDALRGVSQNVNVLTVNSVWNLSGGAERRCHYKALFVRPFRGVRYRGSVHEFLDVTREQCLHIDSVTLKQDRQHDDQKTAKRWNQDVEALWSDISNGIQPQRAMRYLADTLRKLGRFHEAIQCAQQILRKYGPSYRACMCLGDACVSGGLIDEAQKVYLHASSYLRAEPLVRLCIISLEKGDPKACNAFAKRACSLKEPEVDRDLLAWAFHRWYFLSVSCMLLGKKEHTVEAFKHIDSTTVPANFRDPFEKLRVFVERRQLDKKNLTTDKCLRF